MLFTTKPPVRLDLQKEEITFSNSHFEPTSSSEIYRVSQNNTLLDIVVISMIQLIKFGHFWKEFHKLKFSNPYI